MNVWLYKLPPECLKLSDLNVGFSLEGIDFDLGDIEVDFWEGLKEMGKGFAESLYFEKDPEDEKKVILRSEGQKVAAITLESKEKAEELVNISQQTHKASFPVTGGQLKEIFPNTPQARCDEVAALLNKYSDKFGINTPLRMAHFLGQIGVETGGLTKLREIPCYRENSIRREFGKYSKYCDLFEGYNCVDYTACATSSATVPCTPGVPNTSLPLKQKYICTPELFDYVYSCSARKPGSSGDLGNGPPSTKDGSTFLGRGFIQLTGKSNYGSLSDKWNADLDNQNNKKYFNTQAKNGGHIDELETNPDVAMKASMYYWEMKNINPDCDNDDTAKVTYKVKGNEDKGEVKKRGDVKKRAFDVLIH